LATNIVSRFWESLGVKSQIFDSAEKSGVFQQGLFGRKFVSLGIHYHML
jgi:hypothetical protein